MSLTKGAQTPSHDFVVVDEEDPQRSLRFGMHRSTVPHDSAVAAQQPRHRDGGVPQYRLCRSRSL